MSYLRNSDFAAQYITTMILITVPVFEFTNGSFTVAQSSPWYLTTAWSLIQNNSDAKGNDLVEFPKDIWRMSGLNKTDITDNLLTSKVLYNAYWALLSIHQ